MSVVTPARPEAAGPSPGAEANGSKARWNLAGRIGRWSASHRALAIGGWLVFVIGLFLLGNMVGTKKIDSAASGPGETGRALAMLEHAGFEQPASEAVLVQSTQLRSSDPAFAAAVRDLVVRLSALGTVENVRSPYAAGNGGQISRDGRSALVQFEIAGAADSAKARVAPSLAAVSAAAKAHPGLRIEQVGDASVAKAMDATMGKDFTRAEYTSVPLTLAILLLAFGALVAAAVPVVLALTAVVAAFGALGFASQIWPTDESAASVILLIGLAVGVDYSLFYIRREREERAAGKSLGASLEAAAATSGRAVLVSGLTVLTALCSVFVINDRNFTSIGVAAMLAVATAILGSLTVLPALLSLLGDRIDRGRFSFFRRQGRRSSERRGLIAPVLDSVLARPALAAILSVSFLVALAIPAFSIHTVVPGLGSLPRSLPIMKTYDRVQSSFPGGPQPAEVVIRAQNVSDPSLLVAIGQLRKQALASGVMHEPISVETSPDRSVARVSIPLAGDGTDSASNGALKVLRSRLIPNTIGRVPGLTVAVAGATAESYDDNAQLKARAPYVFAFVLGLAFLLLLAAFRSLVISVTAIVLNLLSVGAAYGLLVAIFQWGWGKSLLGVTSIGGITSWLPLFLFIVLFGLSMDYHVFILSRIREAFDRGLGTEEAVREGITRSASVVTSAAIVMVAVFAIFGTLSIIEMKQLGVGLAAAILIDATVVRVVLLPATMKLLGRWNWYLPRLGRSRA